MFSPLLDVLMNFLGALLLLLILYAWLTDRREPPDCVLVLSEKDPSFRFDSGSAEVSEIFRRDFELRILPRIAERASSCDGQVIEVIGHTDAQSLQALSSTLDRDWIAGLRSGNTAGMKPGSNIDLGFMRALAVLGLLKALQGQGRLAGIKELHPLSAGPAILPDYRPGDLGGTEQDAERRRIEIRILRSRR